jgi:putative aldouronate transport system substrate-binding protein
VGLLKKRVITLVSIGMVLAMSTGTLLGCSKKEATNTGGTKEAKQELTKPEKIYLMLDTGLDSTVSDSIDVFENAFKEATGIQLDVTQPVHNQYYEKVDLAFAAAQPIDVIQLPDGKLPKYVGQNALYDMTDLLNNSEAFKTMDAKFVQSSKLSGKLWGAPYERGNGTMTYVRGDWFDKLGIKEPTNYTEFINMLKAFKAQNSDVIPLTAPGLSTATYLVEFYHNARPDFVQRDGKWVDGMSEDIMKDALKRMRDAYADGLMDVEVITNQTSTCREKFEGGRVATFNYWAGKWNDTLQKNVQKKDAKGTVKALPAIQETKYIERTPVFLSIPKSSKIPKEAFKYFIEATQDGDKVTNLFTFGKEGINYEVKDGTVVMKDKPEVKPAAKFATGMMNPELRINKYTSNLKYPLPEVMTSSEALFAKSCVQDVLMPTSKSYSKISADLIALRGKTLAETVLGKTSVDDAIANYKKEAANLGVDNVLQELNSGK